MHRNVHLAAATAFLLLTSFGVATAQDPQPTPKAGMIGVERCDVHDGRLSITCGMMGIMGMAQHVEGWIAFLKVELKITEAQSPQWKTFAEALRSNATRMSGMQTMMQGGGMGKDGAAMSAPDRLDRMEKMLSAMLEMVTATKSAFAPLYAVLTEEQKDADQFGGPMAMGRM